MPPDLLLYPVFDKRKASARMSHRKVVHPSPEDWVNHFDHPPYRLGTDISEGQTYTYQLDQVQQNVPVDEAKFVRPSTYMALFKM